MNPEIRRITDEYLKKVKPAGRDDIVAECPFHDTKSGRPFSISLKTGLWICFSCGAQGNLTQFLTRHGVTQEQAEKRVGKMPSALPEKFRMSRDLKKEWSVLPEYVLGAYRQCPTSLLEAGFDMDILQDHDVGYDRVQDRITFGIRDYLGHLVAVSGRACNNWVEPRYKVYTEEFAGIVDDYEPSTKMHIYGLDTVYPERVNNKSDEPFILVEGYKGCLWMRQRGFRHTVAIMGSTFSQHQEWLIERLPGPYYVMLDWEPGKQFPDERGRCAAVKMTERLCRAGQVFIVEYPEGSPDGTSPDDIENSHTIEQMVNSAKTLTQLRLKEKRHAWLERVQASTE